MMGRLHQRMITTLWLGGVAAWLMPATPAALAQRAEAGLFDAPAALRAGGEFTVRLKVEPGAIDVAKEKLREAPNDAARHAATKELRLALDEYFDKDMEARQQSLEEIRQRVAEMEAQLVKRASAKDEIVDLQLMMFVNEADGLGFFSETDRRGRRTFGVTAGAFPTPAPPAYVPPRPPARP